MAKQTYDPKKIVAIYGTIMIEGYVDGEFISAEPGGDDWAMKVGCDENVCRSKQNHPEGKVTIKLMASSPTNARLQAARNFDVMTGVGALPLIVKDLWGGTVFASSSAWIRAQPKGSFAREVGEVEWNFDCADLKIFIAGNYA